MTAKRQAAHYLTDQNWDQEEESEEAGQFKQADSNVMKGRQIKMAKRKGVSGSNEEKSTGAFQGFGGFGVHAPSASSFTFSSEQSKKLELGSGTVATKTTTNADINENGHKTDTQSKTTKKSRNQYLRQLKVLNESLGKWVNQHVSSNPYCILSPIFSDYEKHLKKLEDNYETEADDGSDEDVEKPVDVSKDVKESTTASVVTSFASSETETTTAASLSFANVFNSSKNVFTGFSGFGNTTSSTSTTGGFTFAVGATDTSAKISPAQGAEDDEYVPPKAQVNEVSEEGAFYTKRCKLFYQKDGSWVDKGVGNLHLKPCDGKTQLIIRADTNLGNILLNIRLTEGMPVGTQGKNNVTLFCVPNPPMHAEMDKRKPCSLLLRVKTSDDMAELEEKIKESLSGNAE